MPPLRTEAIILRKYPLRETSYILAIFSREHGKIRAVIKGARNPAPETAGSLDLFNRCEVLFYRKKKSTLDLVTQCDAVETFFRARRDIQRLTYASYFIELIDVVTMDNDPNGVLYDLLVKALRMLGTEGSPLRVSRIFEIKLLQALGMSPHLASCADCGGRISGEPGFSSRAGGAVCSVCAGGKGRLKISRGTINFLRKITDSDIEKTSRIKVSRDVGRQTEKVLRDFMAFHIARPLKTRKFIEDLREAEGRGR
jgi:DNA repair protein RecO (recombination protein O)